MKLFKSLELFALLIKDASEAIEMKAKEQTNRFLGMLLGALGVSY